MAQGLARGVDINSVTPSAHRDAPVRRSTGSDQERELAAWGALVGFVLVYALAAWLGRLSRLDGTPLALVWPAAAVGYLWLAWSAERGRLYRDVPVLALVAGTVNWATGMSLTLAGVFAVANAVQSLVAVELVRRTSGGWRLRTGGQLGALVAGSLAGAAAGSLVGTAGMAVLLGVDLPSTYVAWVVRNASSMFVFAALAVRVADLGWRSLRSGRRPVEWAGTVAVLTVLYLLIFGDTTPRPIGWAALPLSGWVALRFSTTAAAAHVLLAGVMVVVATAAGYGPFQAQTVFERVVIAQAFVATIGLVALVLALHRDERDRLLRELAAERDGHAAQSALLEGVLETVEVAVVACDAAGRLTLFNRAARDFHGTDADPTVEASGWAERFDLYDTDARTPLAADRVPLAVALREGEVREQVVVIAPHGLPARTVRVDGRRMMDPDGRILGAVVAQTDITRLQASEREFRQAFLSGPTPSARLSADGTIDQINPALRRLLALPSRTLIGRPLVDLAAAEDRTRLAALLAGDNPGPVEARMLRIGGEPLWCEVSATAVTAVLAGSLAERPQAPRLLVQILDVHERRCREERLELAAQRDLLTGLANRAVAHARLAELAGQPANQHAVVAYLDLDGFKAVNDSYGHEAGDAVLLAAAERLRTLVRAGDEIVRLGGDEFLLICPVPLELGSAAGDPPQHAVRLAAALAERAESLLGEPLVFRGQILTVGASVGTVVVCGGSDPVEVLTQADQAMYERKRARKALSEVTVKHGPDVERRRLETLRGLDVLDTAPDPVLDEIVRVAALAAGVPTALVSLVDERRQWFKARCGLDVAETSRDVSFCAHVVDADDELHVHDAIRDPRFADNALVIGEPRIRSYAGFPLRTVDGFVLGSLCVIGYRPTSLDDGQRQVLRVLAGQVASRLASTATGPLPLPAPADGRHDDSVLAET